MHLSRRHEFKFRLYWRKLWLDYLALGLLRIALGSGKRNNGHGYCPKRVLFEVFCCIGVAADARKLGGAAGLFVDGVPVGDCAGAGGAGAEGAEGLEPRLESSVPPARPASPAAPADEPRNDPMPEMAAPIEIGSTMLSIHPFRGMRVPFSDDFRLVWIVTAGEGIRIQRMSEG